MLPEIHTMKKGSFLKSMTHSNIYLIIWFKRLHVKVVILYAESRKAYHKIWPESSLGTKIYMNQYIGLFKRERKYKTYELDPDLTAWASRLIWNFIICIMLYDTNFLNAEDTGMQQKVVKWKFTKRHCRYTLTSYHVKPPIFVAPKIDFIWFIIVVLAGNP